MTRWRKLRPRSQQTDRRTSGITTHYGTTRARNLDNKSKLGQIHVVVSRCVRGHLVVRVARHVSRQPRSLPGALPASVCCPDESWTVPTRCILTAAASPRSAGPRSMSLCAALGSGREGRPGTANRRYVTPKHPATAGARTSSLLRALCSPRRLVTSTPD